MRIADDEQQSHTLPPTPYSLPCFLHFSCKKKDFSFPLPSKAPLLLLTITRRNVATFNKQNDMNNLKYIDQQLKMLMNMLGFLFNPVNVIIISTLQPLKDACALLKTKVVAVEAKVAAYRKLSKALTEAKQKARIDLAVTAFPIFSSVRSYCLKNNLKDVANSLSKTLNEL